MSSKNVVSIVLIPLRIRSVRTFSKDVRSFERRARLS